jgi:MarR family transcriptional regulator, organic hydroperoxide resistance regulator
MSVLNDAVSNEVVGLFRELLHAVLVSSTPAWLDLQLTLPQLRIVFIVAHGESASVTQIAQRLGIGEPTASHLVDKLVQAHLVKRAEDSEDRRRTKVRLTPAGEELIDQLLGWEDLIGGLLDDLPKKDLSLLRQGLHALVDELHVQGSIDSRPPQNED